MGHNQYPRKRMRANKDFEVRDPKSRKRTFVEYGDNIILSDLSILKGVQVFSIQDEFLGVLFGADINNTEYFIEPVTATNIKTA